jgi:phage shock protein PspC (stress-responsive transcriptional regulator)
MESRDDEPATPPPGDTPTGPADAGDASPEPAEAAGDPPTESAPAAGDPPTEPARDAGDPPTDTPQAAGLAPADAPEATSASGAGAAPRRLYRSRDERMIAGVAGGLADYFGVDPVLVRVALVALVFAGGAGVLAYIAAWLLVPEEGAEPSAGAGKIATIAGAIALVCAVFAIVPFGGPWNWGGPFAGLVALGLAGLAVWWMASGEHPSGSGRDVLRRAGLGLALIALCGVFAIGGAWATATGGGAVVAIVVIVAGLWLMAGAFFGGARWLILPALALALPAGVVSAANINVDGGVGDRRYRPTAATEVRNEYRLGAGRLVVDLRNADLPPGDHHTRIEIGLGQAVIAVPGDVCVTSRAKIGAGHVAVFDRESDGVDVDWQDDRTAPRDTPRLIIDGHIGLGEIVVTHDDPLAVSDPDTRPRSSTQVNAACVGGANG